MYAYFFIPFKGIVRVLPLFLRSNLNRDISLFLHSNWNSDISIEKLNVKGDILTYSFLDLFPVFELFIQTSQKYIAINHDIDKCLWGDLKYLDTDMRVIINRLWEISDPYIVQTLLNMETKIVSFIETKDCFPDVKGLPSYTIKYSNFYIYTLRVEYLSYLVG